VGTCGGEALQASGESPIGVTEMEAEGEPPLVDQKQVALHLAEADAERRSAVR